MSKFLKASLLGISFAASVLSASAQILFYGNTYATFTNLTGSGAQLGTVSTTLVASPGTSNPGSPGDTYITQTNRLLSGTPTSGAASKTSISFLGGGNFGVGVGENETFTLGNINLSLGSIFANSSITSFTMNIVGNFRLVGTADASNPDIPTGLTVDSTLNAVTVASFNFTLSSASAPGTISYSLTNAAALSNLSGTMYFGITGGFIPVTYDFGTSSFNVTLMSGASLAATANRALGSIDLANIEFLAPVPEPGTYALVGAGALGLLVLIRQRRSRRA